MKYINCCNFALFGWSLKTVPPRSVPTQTLQRANGQLLDGLNDGAEMYLNEGTTS